MTAVVLVDSRWGIGCDGKQNVFIKEDLQRFKEITQGHTVLLGRKTLATFPQGKPLPKRRNVILSTQTWQVGEGGEVVADIPTALASIAPQEKVFVIGGASVYQAMLPYCQKVLVTKVQKEFPADCFFPNLDQEEAWEKTEEGDLQEEGALFYQYVTYERKNPEIIG